MLINLTIFLELTILGVSVGGASSPLICSWSGIVVCLVFVKVFRKVILPIFLVPKVLVFVKKKFREIISF